jgi:hypothetical protein
MYSVLSFIFVVILTAPISLLDLEQKEDGYRYEVPGVKDGLKISAEMQRSTFQLSKDDMILQITLTNVSQSPITICKRGVWERVLWHSIAIKDEQDNFVFPTFIGERWDEPPLSKEDFITIQPNKFIQQKSVVPLDNFNFKRAGNYRLYVSFYSLYSQEKAPNGLQFWDSKHGSISSKPISFRVVN